MNQSNLIDLLTQGKVENFNEVPERIDTTVSRIFIFANAGTVLKLYRRDNEYWNRNFSDISLGKKRIDFIKEDYIVNQKVNPDVYKDLKAAEVRGGVVYLEHVRDTIDELVIVMNQIEAQNSFIDTLYEGTISESECISIGQQFAAIKNNLDIEEAIPNIDWYQLLSKRLHDLRIWMENLEFSEKDTQHCIQKLTRYIARHRRRLETTLVEYSIDGHGENALYHDAQIQFIDILWPSPHWRWTPKEYDFLRLGADIFALTDENKFAAYLRGVKELIKLEEADRDFYLLYSAALDCCVLKTLVASKPTKEPQLQKYYAWFMNRLKHFV